MDVRVRLDDDDVRRIAVAVAELARARPAQLEGWMDAKTAAAYAGCSPNALHKATASRELRFTQDAPGGKCWFKRGWIDEWRGE